MAAETFIGNADLNKSGSKSAVPSPSVQPILALLAHPVAANPTQYMIEKAFGYHDLDWRYLTLEVAPHQLADAVRGMRAMGFRGGNVASPHQQAISALLDRTTESAALIGAVNLILREDDCLVGENIEGKGLVESLRGLTEPAGKRILLLGAGQEARSVAVELAAAGAAELRLMDRNAAVATELASLVAGKFTAATSATPWEGDCQVPADVDVLINATSIACDEPDARVPVAVESLRPELIVADMTVAPPETRLLLDATSRGCKTLDGLTMLIEQVALGFRLWTGVDPNRQVMREAIEEFLEL